MQLHRINTGRKGVKVGTIRGFIRLRERSYDGDRWCYASEEIEGNVLAQMDGQNSVTYAISNGGQVCYLRQTPYGWYALNAEESRRFAAVANARQSQLQAAA